MKDDQLNELMDLMHKNPGLRIIPIVDSEVVSEEDFSTWWASSFGDSFIDDVCFMSERFYIRSDDEEELINEAIENSGYDLLRTDEENEAWAKGIVNSYGWEKVILVRIDTIKETAI